MGLFSHTIQSLEQALQYSAIRHKVIANNIANADVPNYKAKKLNFHDMLKKAQVEIDTYRTDPRHFELKPSNNKPKIQFQQNFKYNANGNSVDIDSEMSDLAENQIYYQALIERLNGNFAMLSNVIKGGR